MSAVDPINSLLGSTGTRAAAKDTLGQKDFLELMMTQFRNQDPFKPMDSTQFLGQLAQFSTVSGIDAMQASLASLADSYRSDQMLAGAALVGRDILVPSASGTLATEGALRGAAAVPSGTQQVFVQVKDATGQLVRRFEVPVTDGITDFAWDGTLEDGSRAAAGIYTVQAVGITAGRTASLETLLTDTVGSVTLDASSQSLVLNTATQGAVPLASVRRIG
jgi:flagellar basal-body rod modification protein FlgD